jgi:hypothetical protein
MVKWLYCSYEDELSLVKFIKAWKFSLGYVKNEGNLDLTQTKNNKKRENRIINHKKFEGG